MMSILSRLLALWRIVGIVLSVAILTVTAFMASCLDKLARLLVRGLELITTYRIEPRPYNLQRVHNELVYETPNSIINESSSLYYSKFPISASKLIEKTKTLISKEAALGSKMPELLSEDFQFVFPVIGPLTKTEFCTVFGAFKVHEAFPNSVGNYFGFTVDPVEPNRVWFFARGEAKHEGTLNFGSMKFPATGIDVVNTPQMFSYSFDEEGRAYKFTGGYPIDRTVGNCGGLGGLFGIIHAIGGSLPIGPEGNPWKPSLQWEAWVKRFPLISREWKNAQK